MWNAGGFPHSHCHMATEYDRSPAVLHLGMSKTVVVGAGGRLVSIPGDSEGRTGGYIPYISRPSESSSIMSREYVLKLYANAKEMRSKTR